MARRPGTVSHFCRLWLRRLLVAALLAAAPGTAVANSLGDLRLKDGDDPSHGRVEMFLGHAWGAVCDDAWDMKDTRVACRQVGYSGAHSFEKGYTSDGRIAWLPFALDNVDCAGSESRLIDCPRVHDLEVGENNCTVYQQVAVRCTAPDVELDPISLTVLEGGSATYEVSLSAQPSADVTISFSGHSGTDLSLSPASLTFTTTNWGTSQTVTAMAAQDSDRVLDRVVITHSASGGLGSSDIIPTMQVLIVDNDILLEATPAQLSIPRGGTATYTLAPGPHTYSLWLAGLEHYTNSLATIAVETPSGSGLTVVAAPQGVLNPGTSSTIKLRSGDWHWPRAVEVTVPADAEWTDDTATITHDFQGSADSGLAVTFDSVVVTLDGSSGQQAVAPLTVTIAQAPPQHDGTEPFTVSLAFSDEVDIAAEDMRDHALTVSRGTVTAASPVDGRKDRWDLTVEPSGQRAVSILVPFGRACTEAGALCTSDGRTLSAGAAIMIPGPASLPRAVSIAPKAESPVEAKADSSATQRWTRSVKEPARSLTEGSAAVFTLTRAGDTAAELTVAVSVTETGAMVSGTAPSSVTFPAGSATAELSVATEDDEVAEPASEVRATVSSGIGYTIDWSGDRATVTVADDDAAPVITSSGPFTADENATAIATLTATDDDTAVADLAWSLVGGADADKVTLSAGGVLAFEAAKDYEAPDDADADGDYEIEVRVTDGANPVDASLTATLADVDEVAPALSGAGVDGDALTLTFDEALDGTAAPATGAFAVTVGGTARGVSQVAVDGSAATLTLAAAVAAGETVTVSYTAPTGANASPLRDPGGNRVADFSGQAVTNGTPAANTAPTGLPTISGTARVGETLTASAQDIADADGLTNAAFAWQWIANDGTTDSDIADATGDTYTLTAAEEGSTVKVRVTFTDDGDTEETLVSEATAAVESALLTARFGNVPGSHDGSDDFTFELHFSEEFPIGHRTLRDAAFEVSGGTVAKAKRKQKGSDLGWTITVEPETEGDIVVTLPATTDCAATGAVCDGNGRALSEPVTATIPGPASPAREVSIAAKAAAPAGQQSQRSVEAVSGSVTEGSAAVFTLTRTGDAAAALTVAVSVSETGAMVSGTAPTGVTFDAGSSTAELTVATEDDEVAEAASVVTATVSSGNGYAVDSNANSATVTVADDDAAPVITSAGPFTADENGTAIATLTATDEDTAVSDLAWSVVGGADADKVTLSAGGVLAFQAAKDFEAPDDADADGEYEVEVRVTDGANPVDAALTVSLADVDEVAPVLAGASVDGDALTLSFDKGLDGTVAPAMSAFAVTVGGTARGVSQVAVDGSAVTLTLASAVAAGETVTVGYTAPTDADASPLRDPGGNRVADFSGQAVTNDTPAANTAPTGVPTISGTVRVGGTLTASAADIADADGLTNATFAWQWIANDGTTDSEIADATGETYTLTAAEEGRTVKVRVTYTDDGATEETLVSEATAAVEAANAAPTGVPTIGGYPMVSAILQARPSDIRDADGIDWDTLAWQWIVNDGSSDSDIAGATSDTYTPTSAELGKTIKVRLTYTDDGGTEETVVSEPTEAVIPYGALYVSISGSPGVDESLHAFISGGPSIRNGQDDQFAYQWIVSDGTNDVDIEGATEDDYTPTTADVGKAIKARVTFTHNNGTEETYVSAPTAAIKPAVTLVLQDLPAGHDGATRVEIKLHFSDYVYVRGVTNRLTFIGSNPPNWSVESHDPRKTPNGDTAKDFTVWITPRHPDDIEFYFSVYRGSCFATKDICTEDKRRLRERTRTTIPGPLAGHPTIKGTPRVGETLYASSSDITDPDGLTNTTFAWQWIANDGNADTDIAGATDSRYVLTSAEGGKTVKVRVTFIDDGGTEETLVSAATATVEAGNAVPTGHPTISGTPRVGETLTASADGIADADGLTNATFAWQWITYNGMDADIGGATASTYTLTAAEAGTTIKVLVTFIDDADNEEALLSEATASVAAANTAPEGLPAVSGTARVGETLTASASGIADADGLTNATFAWQWIANDGTTDSEIADATDETYTLTSAEEGKTVKVRVTFTDDGDTEEMLVSEATASVAAANASPTGLPTISGTPQVGETLSASASGIADADGLTSASFAWQWIANDGTTDSEISDATSETYMLTSAEEGRTVKVRVTFTDDGDTEETLVSEATASVAAANASPTGLPTISGTARVGETLTASAADIADADGLTNATFAWQWIANDGTTDADIADATGETWTLTSAEAGKTVKVRVTFTDDAETEETLVSEATAAVEAALPVVSIAAASSPVTEGVAAAFTLSRTGDAAEALTVSVSVGEAGSVLSGSPASSVTFDAGSATAALNVATEGDTVAETDGRVTASLAAGPGYDVDADAASAGVDVYDDDEAAAGAVETLWSSTLTVFDLAGVIVGQYAGVGGDLSPDGWTEDGRQFSARSLYYYGAESKVVFHVSAWPPESGQLTLHLDDLQLRLSDVEGAREFNWQIGDPGWQSGQTVAVKLTREDPDAVAVAGPGISVADAQVQEAEGAELSFRVTLAEAQTSAVSVRYATSDGTAVAGSDYVARSGSVRFAPGETTKTVAVPVLNDAHDEGSETMTLTLSHPFGARLADATATGTIVNTDPIPRAWIARFGRTVAEQVIEAVEARMRAPRTPGVEVSLAGRRVGGAAAGTAAEDDAAQAAAQRSLAEWFRNGTDPEHGHGPGSRTVTGRDLVIGSSFSFTGGTEQEGAYALWGRGAVTRFDGREGGLSLDGEVTSGLLGADWSRDAVTAGLMVSHSLGEGGYRGEGGDGGVTSSLTGLWPWGRYALGERLSAWGVAGYGEGTLRLTPAGEASIGTDLDLVMAAAGLRGVLVQAPETGGLELVVKTDAMGVRTSTAKAPGLAAEDADVTRLRLGLEGSRPFRFAGGASLTPSAEIGVRQDGGDAETGFGVDIGGGLAWSDPQRGLSSEVRGRGLLSHAADGFRERGFSGTLSWDPTPETARGLSLSMSHTVGAQAAGGMDALLERGTLAGLAANENGESEFAQRRFELKLGYGLSALGNRFTGTPEIGFGLSATRRDYSLGWRLARDRRPGDIGSLELSLEARRQESANDPHGSGAAPEHALGLKVTARW